MTAPKGKPAAKSSKPSVAGRDYVPTGRPPGRPRADGSPAQPRVRKARPDTAEVQGHPKNAPHAHRPGHHPICPEHFPDGWPKGWTTATCNHDGEARIWARPWVP